MSSTSGGSSFTPPHGHESLPEIERREAVNFWGEEFSLPRGSRALRLRVLGIYIARRGVSADRFIVRVTAAASWERARPSYSLLGANVGAVTITVTDRPARKSEPPPVTILKPALVRTIVQAVNELPVEESAGSAVSCPAEGIGRTSRLLSLSFSEGARGPLLATFTDDPEACVPEPSLALPGEPPVELSEAEGFVHQIERVSALRLR